MTQPIWYDSTEAGAPTLNNVAGSLLEVLRSCLVTGFNAKTVTSIAVASGVATATCAAHGFLSTYGKLVQIAGAPEALLNGNKQPGDVLTNSFTFPAPGVADGTYTGTISAKRAPLGWVEAHTASNRSIFSRGDPAATVYKLRVDDSQVTPATNAEPRVLMVDAVVDVSAFSTVSPTEVQSAGGGRWYKGTPNATPMRWVLVGNGLAFYLFLPGDTTQAALFRQYAVFFGDIRHYIPGDSRRCAIAYNPSAYAGSGFPNGQLGTLGSLTSGDPGATFGVRAAGSFDGVSASVPLPLIGVGLGALGNSTGQASNASMVVIGRPYMVLSGDSTNQVRGEFPGLCNRLSATALDITTPWTLVPGNSGDDRVYLEVRCTIAGSIERSMVFDLTGPWHD
jgi:hypothetical protein